MNYNIAHIELNNYVNGPGKRTVIWFQGCTLACVGCWNTALWSNKPKTMQSLEELLQIIVSQGDNVTLTGGEPLEQDIMPLLVAIKQLNLTSFVFTGYRPAEIPETIIQNATYIKAGRYGEEQINTVNQDIQISISPSGVITFTGYPTNSDIAQLTN